MSVTDCLNELIRLISRVFKNRRKRTHVFPNILVDRYDYKGLENAIKDLSRRKNPAANYREPLYEYEVPYLSDPQMCKT